MTFREYMESGEWRKLDLFPNPDGYKRTYPVMFCAYQAWASAEGVPELGDALVEVTVGGKPGRRRNRSIKAIIRSIGNGMRRRKKDGPTGVECRACGHKWVPEGRIIDARKCGACRSWYIRLTWD